MSIDLPLFPLTPYLPYPISTPQIAYLGRLTVAVAVEAGEMRAPCLMWQSQSGVALAFVVVVGIKAAFPASLETSRISNGRSNGDRFRLACSHTHSILPSSLPCPSYPENPLLHRSIRPQLQAYDHAESLSSSRRR